MCKFIGDLVEKNLGEKMDSHLSQYRIFEPIRINSNLWFSVQASYAHYCTPRETLADLEDYSHWEIALFDKDEFISAAQIVPNFKSLAELQLYFEGQVYPYVPKDLVEELYLALK
jgi:hypothetical protein